MSKAKAAASKTGASKAKSAVQTKDEAVSEAEDAHSAQFEELTPDQEVPASEKQLDVILDVPVTLSLEVGRTQMNVGHLLQLSQGSVVELDRLAGEPLDVLVNGTLIAHGEIVVVNDKFGIRPTDVVSPAERVRKLR